MTPLPLSKVLDLAGKWTGKYRLFVEPMGPGRESESDASVAPVANGRFARIDYDWHFEGEKHSGSILVGYEKKGNLFTATWVDSWHMGDDAMICVGGARGDSIDLRGSYPAPPGPDWGWRTVLEPGPESFRMLMYNVSPEGEEALAVEASYTRVD